MLCLGSIGMDCVVSELSYKGTIIQMNYRKMTILWSFFLYNCATTNLAISSNDTSQDKLSKHKIGSLVLSSRYKTNYINIVHFYMRISVKQ